MLGDQAEKSRNPLKSAIKRRKTKTVQFAGNTYVDYSDIDYSSEEEDTEAEYSAQEQQRQAQQTQSMASEPEGEDETARVEPLKPRGQQNTKAEPKRQESGPESGALSSKAGVRSSEEIFETKVADGPKKTSDGTVRDSFFKDDTVETKKITLTPNLLRDEGPGRSSNDSALKQRPSLDKLEKDVFSKDDKKKKEKKDKEKKPSAIRSFFSRKDKKKGEEDDDSFGKRSIDVDVQEKEPEEEDLQGSPEKGGPQRNPSKLQKQQPRTEPSPTRKPVVTSQKDQGKNAGPFHVQEMRGRGADKAIATMRVVDSEDGFTSSRDQSPVAARKPAPRSATIDDRPQQAVKAKSRVAFDEFDSDDDMDTEPERHVPVRSAPGASKPDSYQAVPAPSQTIKIVPASTTPPQQHVERLSESPVHVSPINSGNPPPLMVDTSSQEEERSSLRSSPSPELIDHEDGDSHGNKDSITTSSSATISSWNDASLRAFFDSGTEIRDLLVVVYDKTDVEPVGPDHPVAGNLFKEQNSKLAEITTVSCILPESQDAN